MWSRVYTIERERKRGKKGLNESGKWRVAIKFTYINIPLNFILMYLQEVHFIEFIKSKISATCSLSGFCEMFHHTESKKK
jgi:hypothetical protein